jgi:predicted TIM-barrel fold metal-dependent hydrolase
MEKVAPLLEDVSRERLRSMDENGISLQIVSVVGEGATLLPPEDAPAFARDYNDAVAERIAPNPERFAAFAHLPLTSPEASALELERTVKTHGFKGALINGLTQDQFLDNPIYSPLLKKAGDLNVPVYLHPGLPPKSVADVYYSEMPNNAGPALSVAGWGWHSETALHVLRTFGIDRILFSVDYPFSKNEQGRAFLDGIDLPKEQIEMIAHGNAEKIMALHRSTALPKVPS